MDGDEIAITYIKDVTFNTNLPDAEILKMTKVGFYLRLKSFLNSQISNKDIKIPQQCAFVLWKLSHQLSLKLAVERHILFSGLRS